MLLCELLSLSLYFYSFLGYGWLFFSDKGSRKLYRLVLRDRLNEKAKKKFSKRKTDHKLWKRQRLITLRFLLHLCMESFCTLCWAIITYAYGALVVSGLIWRALHTQFTKATFWWIGSFVYSHHISAFWTARVPGYVKRQRLWITNGHSISMIRNDKNPRCLFQNFETTFKNCINWVELWCHVAKKFHALSVQKYLYWGWLRNAAHLVLALLTDGWFFEEIQELT